GILDSNTVTVTIDVTPVNDAPTIAAGQNFSVAEDAASGDKVGKLVASDPDSETLTYSIIPASNSDAFTISAGENVSILALNSADGSGVFAINSSTGEITVAGPLDFESVSVYTLTVEVSDGITSSRADIIINVTDVDEAPVIAVDDTATTQGDPVQIGVLNNDQNLDGGAVQITSFTQPANGIVTLNADSTFTYDPNTGFSGKDTFSYTIQDLGGNRTTASVFVTVEAPLTSLSLTDGTQTSAGVYTVGTITESSRYSGTTSLSDDHGSNDLEYVRAAVTEQDALLENINAQEGGSGEVDLLGEVVELASVDPTVTLEAPAAGTEAEAEVAQELSESLQQEAERFEQDRKQMIETLEEVSDLLRCG
ncbi:MAG: Ig-like domain-containing protein, partial [Gammaproteobacteria bacterium]